MFCLMLARRDLGTWWERSAQCPGEGTSVWYPDTKLATIRLSQTSNWTSSGDCLVLAWFKFPKYVLTQILSRMTMAAQQDRLFYVSAASNRLLRHTHLGCLSSTGIWVQASRVAEERKSAGHWKGAGERERRRERERERERDMEREIWREGERERGREGERERERERERQ